MTENEIATHVVDAAFKIHTKLGPGLLESVYQAVMAYELQKRGLRVIREQPIPVVYENVHLEMGFRADLVVEEKVLVELKSIKAIAPIHKKQLLTHLRLTNKRLGLLINFNTELIKDGITRIANGLSPSFACFAALREIFCSRRNSAQRREARKERTE
jgi:GxxExxY protein